jgi:hypothetical protein
MSGPHLLRPRASVQVAGHRVKKAAHRDREEWGGLAKVQFDSERQPELRSGNLKGGSTGVSLWSRYLLCQRVTGISDE